MLKFNLENALELLEINQARLSALADVRPNTVADLLKSNTKRIELETIEKLLDTLNGFAATKGIKKYFQIQDIIQYENDRYADVEEIINKEAFEMMRDVLSKVTIQTPIKGLEAPSITKLLILYEEKLTYGFITTPNMLSSLDNVLLGLSYHLQNYYLAEYISLPGTVSTKFKLTEKGREFVRLLKKHGTS